MAPTPPASGMRRGLSLRASLRRVGSRLRQSAGRKCRTAVTPTGARSGGATVKRSRREYERLRSVSDRHSAGSVRSPVRESCVYEEIPRDTNPFRTYFLAGSGGGEVSREEDSRTRVWGVEQHVYEVIEEDVAADVTNPYEVIREAVSDRLREVVTEDDSSRRDIPDNRNHYEVIRECASVSDAEGEEYARRNDILVERNPYEVIREDGQSNEALIEEASSNHDPDSVSIPFAEINKDSKVCRVLGETDFCKNDLVWRNPYEVVRKEKKEKDQSKAPFNRFEAFKRDSKIRFSGRFLDGLKKRYSETPRNEFEVVRKERKKKKNVKEYLDQKDNSATLYDNPCLQNLANENEVLRTERKNPCLEHTLVDEYLDRPENQGTLNPAFEDLTLKSNLVLPKSKPPRVPFKELNLPLNDSFKENCDPNVVVVKRRRKYSVRFEIDEQVEEEVTTRRFGDVLFDEKKRRPSILKNSRFSQEDDNDSTEELLIKNYELLTRGGKLTRVDSSTSQFVRRRIADVSVEQFGTEEDKENIPVEEKEEALPLPVVSLYYAPEDRMPSKKKVPACRKKMKKKTSDGMLAPKTSSSDIRVLAISTTDSLNHPSILRTDRLCKIVQKFGPEVLMAMGEDGGDSVLAQFKKSLEKPRESAAVEEVEEDEAEDHGMEDEPVGRRGKKRKLAEDVYGEF